MGEGIDAPGDTVAVMDNGVVVHAGSMKELRYEVFWKERRRRPARVFLLRSLKT